MDHTAHLDLDGAWGDGVPGIPRVDALAWGPRLRCFAPPAEAEAFYRDVAAKLPPFVLSGSGDFHHLTALLLRNVQTNVTVISFDNHPDWDIRPPRWACGGWVNRALELPQVRRVSVWGCGNFELRWPHRLFANRQALRGGRLEVHAWAERQSPGVRRRFDCMTRENWRERFERFAQSIGNDVYVTVDLDALGADGAVTNWENGLFTAADVAWAIERVRATGKLVGGDVCGAWSPPKYARWRQRFAAEWDRPKMERPNQEAAAKVNRAALDVVWSALSKVIEPRSGDTFVGRGDQALKGRGNPGSSIRITTEP